MTPKETAAAGLDDLSDDAIDEILARVLTRDAVRTSVLSRPWRHRWKSIPDLDLSFVPIAAVDKTIRLHSAPVRHFKFQIEPRVCWICWGTLEPSFAALARRSSISLRAIDLSLMSSCRLSLCTFAVCCPRLTLIKLTACVILELDLGRRSIFSYLRTLDITDVSFDGDNVDRDSTGYLPMQTYIPPCPKLEKLTLCPTGSALHCDLDTIARHFPRLTHLKLRQIYNLSIVPAALPSLRLLHLRHVYVYGRLSALSSSCPSLEMLSLKYVHFVEEDQLHVASPNLRLLELVHVRGYHALSLSIANSPFLETLLIGLCVESIGSSDDKADGSCNLTKVLGGLPRLKKLTLHDDIIEFLQKGLIPEKLPTSLDHLTHLSIDVGFNHIDEASAVFCLLSSAPNLQVVEFGRRSSLHYINLPVDGESFWTAREHTLPFDNLTTVRIPWTGNEEDELGFVRLVLSKACSLESMLIEFEFDTYLESVVETIAEFPKASLHAQIVFTCQD